MHLLVLFMIDKGVRFYCTTPDIFGQKIQTLYSTDTAVKHALRDANLVIGSVLIPGKKAPKPVKKQYLAHMQPGSVIVDVAVDQGGCCETTKATYHDNLTYEVHSAENLYDCAYQRNAAVWSANRFDGLGGRL